MGTHIKSEKMQPLAQITHSPLVPTRKPIQFLQQQPFRLLNPPRTLHHTRQTIRRRRIPFLHPMHTFPRLRKNIRILRRGKYTIKIRLVESLSRFEDLQRGFGVAEGDFVGRDADYGAVSFVEGHVVRFGVAGPCAPEFPGAGAGGEEGAGELAQRGGVAAPEGADDQEEGEEEGEEGEGMG